MSTVSNEKIWPTIVDWMAPPLAGAAVVIPVFPGFVIKSAQQLGQPTPSITLRDVIAKGGRAAPIIGAQIGMEALVSRLVKEKLTDPQDPWAQAKTTGISAFVVGTLSVPGLAILNGLSANKLMKECLTHLSPKEAGAILIRENLFLLSLSTTDPMKKWIGKKYGEHPVLEWSTECVTTAFWSLVNHPADTALTLWQQGRKIESVTQLWRGAPVRVATICVFSALFKIGKQLIISNNQ